MELNETSKWTTIKHTRHSTQSPSDRHDSASDRQRSPYHRRCSELQLALSSSNRGLLTKGANATASADHFCLRHTHSSSSSWIHLRCSDLQLDTVEQAYLLQEGSKRNVSTHWKGSARRHQLLISIRHIGPHPFVLSSAIRRRHMLAAEGMSRSSRGARAAHHLSRTRVFDRRRMTGPNRLVSMAGPTIVHDPTLCAVYGTLHGILLSGYPLSARYDTPNKEAQARTLRPSFVPFLKPIRFD